jgi:hypothetical protein
VKRRLFALRPAKRVMAYGMTHLTGIVNRLGAKMPQAMLRVKRYTKPIHRIASRSRSKGEGMTSQKLPIPYGYVKGSVDGCASCRQKL